MSFIPPPAPPHSNAINSHDLSVKVNEEDGRPKYPAGKLIIYGSRFSYFTQKLVAAATWYSLDAVETAVNGPNLASELRARSGTHQIPVVKTSEGFVLADTTPIMRVYLDGRLGLSRGARLYGRKHETPGVTRAVIALIEEYFDEWIPRLAVHFRWNKRESSEVSAPKMIEEQLGFQREKDPEVFDGALASLKTWGPKSCRATGISSPLQQDRGDEECARIFSAMERHLGQGRGPFLFGRVPCAVDASLYGGLYAHFLHDEYPKRRIFAALPRVAHWVDTALTSFHVSDSSLPPTNNNFTSSSALPEFAEVLLAEMKIGFVGFVAGNRAALADKSKSYFTEVYGERVSFLAREYVEHSRRMLVRFISEECLLGPKEVGEFRALVATHHLEGLFPEMEDMVRMTKTRNGRL